jgi:hypothetical protein
VERRSMLAARERALFIFVLLIGIAFIVGCVEKEEVIDDDDDIDDRPIYNSTISLDGEFGDLESPKMKIDSDGNAHFVWVVDHHKDIRFYREVMYSKYDSEMNPLIEELMLLNGEISSAERAQIPMEFDSQGNLHFIISRVVDYMISDIHIGQEMVHVKLSPDGTILQNSTVPRNIKGAYPEGISQSSARDPRMVMDSNDHLHLFWWDWGEIGSGSSSIMLRDIHYSKLDSNGAILIPDTRITDEDKETNRYPDIHLDSKNRIHVTWQYRPASADNQIHYVKLDGTGDDLVILKGPMIIGEGYRTASYPNDDGLVLFWIEFKDEKTMKTKIDSEGNIISTEEVDPKERLSKEERKNMHLFGMEGWSCAREDVVLNLTTYDENGDIVLDNKTILTILRNPSYDHGPAVFDFQYQVDPEGDIHVAYFVNNGRNGFQVHYLHFNSKGDLVAPVFIVAPLS